MLNESARRLARFARQGKRLAALLESGSELGHRLTGTAIRLAGIPLFDRRAAHEDQANRAFPNLSGPGGDL